MDNEIETLKAKLEKAESEKLAVAQLARDILLKDEEKDQRLATLGEENLQQSRDIARLQALLTSRDEYLAEMENEIAKLQNEVATLNDKKSSYLVELEQKISSLHAQVTEKNAILSDTGQEVLQLKKNLAIKERELEEALKKTPEKMSSNESPNLDREKNMFAIKLAEFETERSKLLDEISQLQDKTTQINRDLVNEHAHAEELTVICNGYRRDVEELRKRCNDLTVELNECRSTTKAASKGNSMFFEFVDERIKLEKDLLKLKARNDFLVHQNDVYQRQIGDLRHELMFALSLATGTGTSDGDSIALQQEISRLRTELSTVNAKLLEKQDENVEREEPRTSTMKQQQLVNLKDSAFRCLNEQVRSLTGKVDNLQRERSEYFDKFREYERLHSAECRRSRQLQSEVECLKQRLLIEQRRNAMKISPLQSIKPLREKLTEKIENINKLDAGDPTISDVQSMNTFTDSSLASSKLSCGSKNSAPDENAADERPSCSKTLSVGDQNSGTLTSQINETNCASNPVQQDVPVEKRVKFKPTDESWTSRNAADSYPLRRKPRRRVINKVHKVSNLHLG